MKQKFTNLYVAVDGNRENLYREIPCSKNFWNESSIQVETYGIEITSSGTFHKWNHVSQLLNFSRHMNFPRQMKKPI